MGDKRAHLSFDDDEQIDLEELTGAQQRPKSSKEDIKRIDKVSEKAGFVSREPKKRRRVSPYSAQFGGKCREGMKELFQEIGERMGVYDTQTLESAIFALIEKQGFDDLKEKYNKLIER